MKRHEVKVAVDYHQFYVWDAGVEPQAPEEYTDEDVRRLVKVSPHVVVVQPVRDGSVPVQLEIHESDPSVESDDWQHIVECTLDLPTGKLQVHECTGGPVLDVEVQPGVYNVRVLITGLDSLSEDGFDGDDVYRVILWRGEPRLLRVVKQWEAG